MERRKKRSEAAGVLGAVADREASLLSAVRVEARRLDLAQLWSTAHERYEAAVARVVGIGQRIEEAVNIAGALAVGATKLTLTARV